MKSAICCLICLGIALPVLAQTRLYGSINSGWESADYRSPDLRSQRYSVQDRGSYIGMSGSFSFTEGSKLIWQLEQASPTTGQSSFQQYLQQQRQQTAWPAPVSSE